MLGASTTQQVDLVVQGHATTDLGPLEIALRLDAGVRRMGRGPLELRVAAADWALTGVELLWMVTTNKGWVHLRGSARLADGGADQPVRMDIYGGGLGTPADPDRIALRLYPAGSDPNLAGPIVKLMGTFEGPAVSGVETVSRASPER